MLRIGGRPRWGSAHESDLEPATQNRKSAQFAATGPAPAMFDAAGIFPPFRGGPMSSLPACACRGEKVAALRACRSIGARFGGCDVDVHVLEPAIWPQTGACPHHELLVTCGLREGLLHKFIATLPKIRHARTRALRRPFRASAQAASGRGSAPITALPLTSGGRILPIRRLRSPIAPMKARPDGAAMYRGSQCGSNFCL